MKDRPSYYFLDGKRAVPTENILEWAKTFENKGRIVAATILPDNSRVSTVFLGLDHSFGIGGPPILFETMIFGGPHDGYQERCSTWDEAEAQHLEAVKFATTGE